MEDSGDVEEVGFILDETRGHLDQQCLCLGLPLQLLTKLLLDRQALDILYMYSAFIGGYSGSDSDSDNCRNLNVHLSISGFLSPTQVGFRGWWSSP